MDLKIQIWMLDAPHKHSFADPETNHGQITPPFQGSHFAKTATEAQRKVSVCSLTTKIGPLLILLMQATGDE
jgi:hypothetical protein